jgi:PAS domain S-box-containing protein
MWEGSMNWVDRQDSNARDSQVSHSAQLIANWLQGMAWLPVVIFFITIIVLAFLHIDVVWNPPNLLKTLNISFLTIITFLVSLLAARSYLKNHSSFFLLLGCGMLVFGLGGIIAVLPFGKPGPNWNVTVYDLSAFLAGICLMVSAIAGWSVKPRRLRSGWPVLLTFYFGIIVIESILALVVRNELLPVFFVDGHGATIYDLLTLWTTAGLFIASAILLKINYGASKSNFYYWCTLGLGLIAIGLVGVSLQTKFGSPLNWASRCSQYLGGVYLLIATISSFRKSGTWILPLEKALRESESRYRSLVESSPDGIVVHRNGRFLFANSIALKMYGADTLEQLQTKTVPDLIHPDDRDAIKARMQQALVEQRVQLRETKMMSLDGRFTHVETVGSMVDFQGEPAVQIIIRDITQRKLAEQGIEHLASFPRLNPNPVIEIDSHGTVTYFNEATDNVLKELGADNDKRIFLPDDFDEIMKSLQDGKESYSIYRELEVKGRFFAETIHLLRELRVVRLYLIDITERKQAESQMEAALAALQQSEAKYKFLTESILDVFTAIDRDQRFTYWNKVSEELSGISAEEALGKTRSELFGDNENSRKAVGYQLECIKTNQPLRYENEVVLKGRRFVFDVRLFPTDDGATIISRDITERKIAEELLLESEERFRAIAETLPVLISVSRTEDSTIVFTNTIYNDVFGFRKEEIIGRKGPDVYYDPVDRKKMIDILKEQGFVSDYQLKVKKSDGTPLWLLSSVRPTIYDGKPSIIAASIDITRRKQAEEELQRYREHLEELIMQRTQELEDKNLQLHKEMIERVHAEEEKNKLEIQLIQAQRMEALGKLAGGIAHDLNNILQPILINSEMISDKLPQGTQEREYLDQIIDAAQFGKNLIKQIKTYGSSQKPTLKPIPIGQVVHKALTIVNRTLSSDIKLNQHVPMNEHLVNADSTQINQLVLNLCLNAVQSMTPQGGTLDVSLDETVVTQSTPAIGNDLNPGKYMKLTVTDTGSGIDPEIMKNIFDPFFTTRKSDKGTGLGLAVVYEVVKNSQGSILLSSEVGKGTRFEIYFPVHLDSLN